MALQLLNESCAPKGYTSFSELAVGAYKITKFNACETKLYGKKITAEFGLNYVYLPKSVALNEEALEELNKSPVYMIYKGRGPRNQ